MNPKIRNNEKEIISFLNIIKKDAKDCIGGKKVTILRKDWIKFEKLMKELSDDNKDLLNL